MGHYILQIGAIGLIKLFFVVLTCVLWPKGFHHSHMLGKKGRSKQRIKEKKMKKTIGNKVRLYVFKAVYYLNRKMNYAFYWGVFNSMEVDLFLGVWTTLKVLTKFTFYSIVSTIILISLVLNYFVYIGVIGYGYFNYFLPKQKKKFTKYQEKIYKRKNENFLGIFEGVNPSNVLGAWIYALIAIKDLLLPVILIYGIESAYL